MFRRALFAGPFAKCLVVAVTITLSASGFAQTETVLHNFANSGTQPYYPTANLIFDTAGNLYGTTESGGTYGGGTVFELMPKVGGGWASRVLHNFNPAVDGSGPGNLIFDASGNLYGVASGGGTDNVGTVFELIAQVGGGWHARLLHTFKNDGIDGQTPVAGLTFDAAGDLFGVTAFGGGGNGCFSSGCGTVYELVLRSGVWAEKILIHFSESAGYNPQGSVTFDGSGNLFGTTAYGGSGNLGTLFELTPRTGGVWTETVLHNFSNDGDGYIPRTGVIFDAAGNLYGTTYEGGPNGEGTVFEMTPGGGGTWTETILYSFPASTSDGFGPLFGTVVFDTAGNLYGTTANGGVGYNGTLFELSPGAGGTWTESLVWNFDGTDGLFPNSGVIFGSDGRLYGTTPLGGTYSQGVVYALTP